MKTGVQKKKRSRGIHMADSADREASQSGSAGSLPTKKRGRAATTLKSLTLARANDKKFSIEFDKNGEPIGPLAKKFLGFVAVTAKSHASILIDDWSKVPKSVNDQIWESITLTWDVPNTYEHKKKWLSRAAKRWTGFKSFLGKQYIFGEKQGKSPLEVYPYLDQETWDKFVASRYESHFLVKRERGKAIQEKNVHPHTMSQGGYRLVQKKLMEEKKLRKRKEKEEAGEEAGEEEGEETIDNPPSPPPREDVWVAGRKTKTGDFKVEATRAVAEKIVDLKQQSSQGSFVPHGRSDILCVALGKDDHPGRVRGVPGTVGIKKYHGSRGSRVRDEQAIDKDELLSELKEELRDEFKQEFVSSLLKNPSLMQSIFMQFSAMQTQEAPTVQPSPLTTKGSCPKTHVEGDDEDEEREDIDKHSPSKPSIPSPQGGKSTSLPQDNTAQSKPRRRRSIVARLAAFGVDYKDDLTVMPLEHDGAHGMPYTSFSGEDMSQFCVDGQWIANTVLSIWCTYLYRLTVERGNDGVYGFLEPGVTLLDFFTNSQAVSRYMQTLLDSPMRKEIYMAPFLRNHHWQLLLLIPSRHIVVFFCSLHREPAKDVKNAIDTAMISCGLACANGKSRTPKIKRLPEWIVPKSHRQTNSWECVYYVMSCMLTIISAGITDKWKEVFSDESALTGNEFNDLRERFATFFFKYAKEKNVAIDYEEYLADI